MAETSRLQVSKLTSANWASWKYQIQLYLRANGLWRIVQGEENRPAVDDEEDEEAAAAAVAWDGKEDRARAVLGLTVDDSLLYLITNKETSAETYTALRDHFEKTNATNVYFLLSQLYKLELQENASVDKHLKIFTELCNKLLAVELQLPEPVKIAALLESLPSSYQVLRTTLQMKGELQLEGVIQAIASEDQQRRGKKKASGGRSSAADSALQASGFRGRGRGRGRGSNNYFSRGGGQEGAQGGRGGGQGQFQGQCFKCGKWGHTSRNCRSAGREQAATADEQLIVASDEKYKNEDNPDEREREDALSMAKNVDAQWIVDSGASSHMTSSRGAITDFCYFSEPRRVRLGDGRALPALGSGRVVLQLSTTTGGWPQVTLSDVLLIPDLCCSLVSVRAVLDKGKAVQFEGNNCSIKMKDGRTVATGRRVDKLFLLNLRGQDDQAAVATTTVPIQIWHQRLGHLNEAKLRKLIADGAVSSSGKFDFCRGCIEGKLARRPFPTSTSPKTTQLLELVHSDVCGPMSVQSPGGKRYVAVFLDDYSRWSQVYFLRHKSEVFSAFVEFKTWAEKQTGLQLKRLRSDGGG